MQGAMRRMSISTGQASAGGSGTSNVLSNSMLLGSLGDAAVRLRPARGVVQELLDFVELDRIELAAGLGEFEHVPPRGEMVQRDAEVAQDILALGIDVVKEDHEDMLDRRARLAQRVAEIDLAAA